ncbi:MAG: hypothetical protein AAF862_15575, partial [Pseudomonadota bacterium]
MKLSALILNIAVFGAITFYYTVTAFAFSNASARCIFPPTPLSNERSDPSAHLAFEHMQLCIRSHPNIAFEYSKHLRAEMKSYIYQNITTKQADILSIFNGIDDKFLEQKIIKDNKYLRSY